MVQDAEHDVLSGSVGDQDQLLAGAERDISLDGEGITMAQGSPSDLSFTIALSNGWRDMAGQSCFISLASDYDNETLGLLS